MAIENNCIFVGRLGADPVLRYTQTGDSVSNFRIAVNEQFGVDGNGNRKEVTTWVNGVAWRRLAEVIAEHCHKGDMIGLQGRMRNRAWTDQDGNERYTTEIVADSIKFLSPKNGNGNGKKPAAQGEIPPPPDESQIPQVPQIPPDDIPF